jgi:hypothetical protein
MRLSGLWLLGTAAAGALLGLFAAHQHSASVLGMIVGFAIYPALLLSTASGVSLAADLRRPIWWLSSESLATRLAVWTLATSLRGMALIAVGLASAAVASGASASVLPALPLGMLAIWLLRSVGLAIYALLPSQLDLRGPGAVLRLILSMALLLPAGVIAGVAGAFGGAGAALAAGAVAAALEGLLLVLFAASQLKGNGMAVAQAEQR